MLGETTSTASLSHNRSPVIGDQRTSQHRISFRGRKCHDSLLGDIHACTIAKMYSPHSRNPADTGKMTLIQRLTDRPAVGI